MFRVVIPARYASARLPGKALMSIGGKPMVQWVYERARASGADDVLIATDDPLILSAGHSFGSEVIMTSASHASGTDRIAEVARKQSWPSETIVVNVQGDEPLIPPALIGQVAKLLEEHPQADVATLATAIDTLEEFLNPNVVKVVTDSEGRALYFSRAPIPWSRDGAPPASRANGCLRGRGGMSGFTPTGSGPCCGSPRSPPRRWKQPRSSSSCARSRMGSKSASGTLSSTPART